MFVIPSALFNFLILPVKQLFQLQDESTELFGDDLTFRYESFFKTVFLMRMNVGCVCMCVFFQFILDMKFVGRTSRGHTGGRSHRISHPPSFCGACLNFSREKGSAIPFPRRLCEVGFCVLTI